MAWVKGVLRGLHQGVSDEDAPPLLLLLVSELKSESTALQVALMAIQVVSQRPLLAELLDATCIANGWSLIGSILGLAFRELPLRDVHGALKRRRCRPHREPGPGDRRQDYLGDRRWQASWACDFQFFDFFLMALFSTASIDALHDEIWVSGRSILLVEACGVIVDQD